MDHPDVAPPHPGLLPSHGPLVDPRRATLLRAARLACVADSDRCLGQIIALGLDPDDPALGVPLIGYCILYGSPRCLCTLLRAGADPVNLQCRAHFPSQGFAETEATLQAIVQESFGVALTAARI